MMFEGGSAGKRGRALGEPFIEPDQACRKTGLSDFSAGEYAYDVGGS